MGAVRTPKPTFAESEVLQQCREAPLRASVHLQAVGFQAILGTLSTENGNRNGDAETAGRLGRERGFGALLKAVKQHRENADCKKPLYICTGVLVAVMSSLRAVRNQLLISHNEGVISDEEFLLLYDL